MATKKSTSKTNKSRVASKTTKKSLISKPVAIVLGLLLILSIVVIGIMFVNDSNASTSIRYVNTSGWKVVGKASNGSFLDLQWLPNSGIAARATYWGKYNSGVSKYIIRSSQNIGARDKCAYLGPQGHTLESAVRFKSTNSPSSFFVGQNINMFVTDSCNE